MISRSLNCACLGLAGLFALPAIHAASSSHTDTQTDEIETMVVSAHRTPTPRFDLGSAVSIVDETTITQRQQTFAGDLLRDLPGVALSRNAGFGSLTQVRVRGSEGNHVLVVIDGVEANDPALGDEFDFARLTTSDIQNIELVRGPQSALWGSDALAGIVHVTTRSDQAGFAARGLVEGGSFGTVNGAGSVTFNGVDAGVTLNASSYDSDSISAAEAGREEDGYQNQTFGVNATWSPGPVYIGFSSCYTEDTVDFDGTSFVTGLPEDTDEYSENEQLLASLTAAVSLLDGRSEHSLKLTWLESERQNYAGSAKGTFTGAEKTGVYYQTSYLFGPAKQAGHQRVTLALDYEDEKFEQRGMASFYGDPNQTQKMNSKALVFEYFALPVEGLNISLSTRFDDNSDFDQVTTYRGTGTYLFGSDTRLRFSAGTGQKRPTFLDRFGFFPDQFVGNPNLQPEKSRGYDVGVTQGFYEGRLILEATWFDETLEDEIDGFANVAGSFLATAVNRRGESERQGIELSLTAELSEDIAISASYTYTDTQQPDGMGGQEREVRRPEHMAAVNFNQSFARANLNVNISYTGEQLDQYYPPPGYARTMVRLPGYVLINVSGEYRINDWLELTGRFENLFDETYTDVLGFQAPGRGAYVGVRLMTGR
ncbi:MAG: TonB-dependent receptor [Proteobacteria bacterium]|nr:TonB-dependent receptor [Pseudomonadota bacterium]